MQVGEFICEVESDGKALVSGMTTTGDRTVHKYTLKIRDANSEPMSNRTFHHLIQAIRCFYCLPYLLWKTPSSTLLRLLLFATLVFYWNVFPFTFYTYVASVSI